MRHDPRKFLIAHSTFYTRILLFFKNFVFPHKFKLGVIFYLRLIRSSGTSINDFFSERTRRRRITSHLVYSFIQMFSSHFTWQWILLLDEQEEDCVTTCGSVFALSPGENRVIALDPSFIVRFPHMSDVMARDRGATYVFNRGLYRILSITKVYRVLCDHTGGYLGTPSGGKSL